MEKVTLKSVSEMTDQEKFIFAITTEIHALRRDVVGCAIIALFLWIASRWV
jgi:hypothetical protein